MKTVKFLLVALLTVFAVTVFAQDSTLVAAAQSGIAMAETKWPFVAKVVAALAIVSEVLAIIPSQYVPANGVLDIVIKWIKAIFGKK